MQPLLAYFAAEKRGAMVLLAGGVIGVGVAAAMMMVPNAFAGAGIPLVALGLLAVGIGSGVWARTDHQVTWLADQLQRSAVAAAAIEVPRMERVRRSFRIAFAFEVLVIAAGVGLSAAFRSNPLLFSAGLGCIVAGMLLLVFDLVADRRAARYLACARNWTEARR